MTHILKIRQIGNSLGVVLPKEMLAKLRVEKGTEITAVETSSGFEITSSDPEFQRDLELIEEVSRKYRNALKELAK